MKRKLLIGVSAMLMNIAVQGQQLWDDFDGAPSPAIAGYTYVDGGWSQVNFTFTNPNSTGNTSSTCLQYTKPASTYQKIYIGPAVGYTIDDVSDFKSDDKSFSIKILNAAGTEISVQIGLNDNSKTTGAWPAGRHSTYTATTSTSTDWQVLTFAYDENVAEDATVGVEDINEIIIEINGSSAATGVYLLDDLYLAEVTGTTGLTASSSANTLFKLEQNKPNPFQNSTKISYTLASPSEVALEVSDMMGNTLYTVWNGYNPAGEFQVEVTSDNLPEGIYYYRLTAGGVVETRKMVVVK